MKNKRHATPKGSISKTAILRIICLSTALLTAACSTTSSETSRLVDNPARGHEEGQSLNQTGHGGNAYLEKEKAEFLADDAAGKNRQPISEGEIEAQVKFQQDQERAKELLREQEEYIPVAVPANAPGKVHSPFSPGDMIDVSGFPSGSVAKCPYTLKSFRVP